MVTVTCIIGVVCADGIVLVDDKKIKSTRMAGFENKIVPINTYENTVLAAAGFLDIRSKFMQDNQRFFHKS